MLDFERDTGRLNLTLAQCKVLAYLQRNEGISQTRLAYLTDTDPMTLGRILDRMEADGLIERKPNPADRRARSLFLQEPAFPVLKEIWRHSDRARARALAGLTASERELVLDLLQHIHGNLARLAPDMADNTAGVFPKRPGRRSQAHAEGDNS
ncbi:MAG: MarR family transcriptional regulator [Sterolibacterium sp.]